MVSINANASVNTINLRSLAQNSLLVWYTLHERAFRVGTTVGGGNYVGNKKEREKVQLSKVSK